MKGLLSSCVLKGPAQRLSYALYNHKKLRKRSSRTKPLFKEGPFGSKEALRVRGDESLEDDHNCTGKDTSSTEDEEEDVEVKLQTRNGSAGESSRKEVVDIYGTDADDIDEDEESDTVRTDNTITEDDAEDSDDYDSGREEESTNILLRHGQVAHDERASECPDQLGNSLGGLEDGPQQDEGVSKGEDLPQGPIIPADWKNAVQSICKCSAAVVFVCGGKNTGKSTFARYLVNSLINRYGRVGFLDTDLGQPELTPSGCLSLHLLDNPIVGLPALEMKDPTRCYYFGDVSPKSNPEDYLKSIFLLYSHFKGNCTLKQANNSVNILNERQEGVVNLLDQEQVPLVINTHGWIQGTGFDVLVEMICHVMPTHIVQILSKTPSRNLPPHHFWKHRVVNSFHTEIVFIWNAVGYNTHLAEVKFNARELRDLRTVSYFEKIFKQRAVPTSKLSSLFVHAAASLACCKPFQVPISAIRVVHQHFQVPECESVYSLNATIVGLGVRCEKGSQETKPRCVGLGIVRAVDVPKRLFHVITPMELHRLQQVDTFLQGRIEIPACLLQAPKFVSPYLCSNAIAIEGTGSAVMGKGKKKALRM